MVRQLATAALATALLLAACDALAPVEPTPGRAATASPAALTTAPPTPSPSPLPTLRPSPRVTASPTPAPTATPSPRPVGGAGLDPTDFDVPEGITLDVRERPYEVTGNSASALLRSMRRIVLVDGTGARGFALATWSITWSYNYTTSGDRCDIGPPRTIVTATIDMPQWKQPDAAPPPLVRSWRRFIRRLREHEREHVQIALDQASKVAPLLDALPPRATCAQAEAAADAAGDALIARTIRRQVRYDRRTGHGVTQGAVWP